MNLAQSAAAALGKHQRKANGGFMTQCPAHDDRNPSPAIDEGESGLLVKCFAGCSQDAVIDAMKSRGVHLTNEASPLAAPQGPRRNEIWTPILPVPADAPAPPGTTPPTRQAMRHMDISQRRWETLAPHIPL